MADELARLIIKVDGSDAAKASKQVDGLTKSVGDAEGRISTLSGRVKKAAGDTEAFRARTAATQAEWAKLAGTTGNASTKFTEAARSMTGAGRAADATSASISQIRVSSAAAEASMVQASRNAVAALARLSGVSATAGGAITGSFGGAARAVAGLAGLMLPGGILASAIAIGATSIVGMFTSARDELEKTEKEFTTRLDRMRANADGAGLTEQAFTVNRDLTGKRSQLRGLEDPNGKSVGDLLRSTGERERLAREIADLEKKAQRVLQATLNPAAQYSPQSGTPIRVTADSPELIRKRQAEAAKARLDAEVDELNGIREFNEFRNGELKERRALAVLAARAREREIKSFLLAASGTVRGVGIGATEGTAGDFVRAANAPAAAARQAAEDAAEQITKQQDRLSQALADGLQRSLADGIQGGFRTGLRSVGEFGNALRNTIERAAAEALASKALRALANAFGGSAAGGTSGAASRLLGSVVSLGGSKGAGAVLGGGKTASAAKAAGGFSGGGALASGGAGFLLGNAIGQNNGGTAGALGGAASGAASGALIGSIVPGLGTVVGGVIGGAAGLLGGLFGGNSKKKKQQEAARKLAQEAATFSEDLIIRTMEASGDELGADKKRQEIAQKAELEAVAKKFGKNSKEYKATEATQAKEREAASRNGDDTMAAGTYLAPAGFDATPYRFNAGRPTSPPSSPSSPDGGMTLTGNTINIVVPDGTPRAQAEQIVRELQNIASSQGYSPDRWWQTAVQ